jgi:hypothetical protein
MVKDFLVSFSNNFKEKTKNPFLGTYLAVWFIRNWELIYTLFNFDDDCDLNDKVTFIKNYYNSNDFIENLLTNILWAFIILILTYSLLNISRFIVNLFEKQLTPWVYKKTDSKSIVLKSDYERLKAERNDLQEWLDKERESKSRLESRIKYLENEITEITKTKKDQELDDSEKNDPTSEIIFSKLKEKELTKEFMDICTLINKGTPIKNNVSAKDYFVELGLITFANPYNSEAKMYKITSIGEKIIHKLRLE